MKKINLEDVTKVGDSHKVIIAVINSSPAVYTIEQITTNFVNITYNENFTSPDGKTQGTITKRATVSKGYFLDAINNAGKETNKPEPKGKKQKTVTNEEKKKVKGKK